ncbi:MAG TPA: hypothetical protein VFH66_00840 [Mycobacteriales bacterium]|nr:hypothetical protein [Mycobacteriales bacterium]
MRLPRFLVGSAMTVALLAPMAPAHAAEVDLYAGLHHGRYFSTVTGYSEYERTSHSREVEVTVRHLPKWMVGRHVTVYVAGHKVGTMLVRTYGYAHRDWDTTRSQYVPYAAVGSLVRVWAPGGRLIASGKYVYDWSS